MARKATRQAVPTTAAMTMPAMAPEERCEDDLDAIGLLEGLDTLGAMAAGEGEEVATGVWIDQHDEGFAGNCRGGDRSTYLL